MKNITDKFKIELDEKLSEEFENFQGELTFGGIKIKKSILTCFAKLGRKYESENINDIKNNYNELAKCSRIPLYLLCWTANFSIKVFKKYGKDIFDCAEERNFYPTNYKIFPPSFNINKCNLDSVKIRNVKHIPNKDSITKPKFKAIEFNVYDRFDDFLPAVFIYKDDIPLLPQVIYEENRKQLENVLSSTEVDTFDITFGVLDEKAKGKMLIVDDIRKNRLDNEERMEIPEESDKISDLERKFLGVSSLLKI